VGIRPGNLGAGYSSMPVADDNLNYHYYHHSSVRDMVGGGGGSGGGSGQDRLICFTLHLSRIVRSLYAQWGSCQT